MKFLVIWVCVTNGWGIPRTTSYDIAESYTELLKLLNDFERKEIQVVQVVPIKESELNDNK